METGRQLTLNLPENKYVYFASDQHFGSPNKIESREREHRFITWLDEIKIDCQYLFLLGDLFDFWFEYKEVVPRGFVRILGKLAELSDSGVQIYFFTGNHDLWMLDYLEKELNAIVFKTPQEFTIENKLFLIGHGDGLGPGDKGFKRLKKIFVNPITQFLYRYLIHPDLAVWFGRNLSQRNKMISGEEEAQFLGEDKEWLVQYSKRKLDQKHYDFFVFGHRHLPLNIDLNEKAKYINLGDWIQHYTYARFDGEELSLLGIKNLQS